MSYTAQLAMTSMCLNYHMTLTPKRVFVCAKVSKTDTYSQARCTDYVLARHKMIYEAFDWKTAQLIVEKTIASTGATVTTLAVPEVHHVLSVRLDGILLDPVSASFIFEHSSTAKDDYATAGVPKHYEEFNDVTTGTRSLRFFPPLADTGASHSLVVLGKTPYNDAWTSPAIPQTENSLIAYVTGDMWEYLHQVGKSQVKFTEAASLIETAKGEDKPAPLRPRTTKRLTANGNSLSELADSVCDLISDWTPQTRISVKERIRRNFQSVWDSTAWPEAMILSSLTAINGVAILPHLIDRVIGVRINLDITTSTFKQLEYGDNQLFFGVQPDIFDSTGEPISYNLMLPVGLSNLVTGAQLNVILSANEKADVTIRGELSGNEVSETIKATNVVATSVNSYDVVYTISKPITAGSLLVKDTGNVLLMTLGPNEHDRKYPRIKILPAFDSTADQTLFVLGKRRLPQLLEDGDTPQLTSIENILINSAASDMLLKKGDAASATAYKSAASSALQTLVDRETKQATYQPRVLPYTEPDANWWSGPEIP